MVGEPADRAAPSSTISTVRRSEWRTTIAKRLTSWRRSPLGEKGARALRSSTTGAAPFRRWATKNAAKVAATSTTKAASAARDTVSAYGDWSAPTITTTSACTGLANELFASDCVSVSRGVTELTESALATSIA